MTSGITIGFSKSKKKFAIGSWAIRLYQNTEYSHVYLKFHSEALNRVLIYEAVGGGVRFIGSSAWEKQAIEVASFDLDIKQCNYVTLLQFCVDHAGLEYGFLQNIGLLFCDLFKMKENPFKKGKNCSEMVAEILKLEGVVINKDFNLVTPKDIFEVLSENQSSR